MMGEKMNELKSEESLSGSVQTTTAEVFSSWLKTLSQLLRSVKQRSHCLRCSEPVVDPLQLLQ